MMSTQIERRPTMAVMSDDEITRSWRIAQALAGSGLFKDATSAEQAFAKMLVGLDLGMTPTQALMGVYMVEGKPQISSTVLAGFVRKSPGYDSLVTKLDDHECSIEFVRVP